jgi:hypothetical protein
MTNSVPAEQVVLALVNSGDRRFGHLSKKPALGGLGGLGGFLEFYDDRLHDLERRCNHDRGGDLWVLAGVY